MTRNLHGSRQDKLLVGGHLGPTVHMLALPTATRLPVHPALRPCTSPRRYRNVQEGGAGRVLLGGVQDQRTLHSEQHTKQMCSSTLQQQ